MGDLPNEPPSTGAPMSSVPPSPVPAQVAVELARIVRRWQQLPLDRVESVAPGTTSTYAERVRALVQRLADATDEKLLVVGDSRVAGHQQSPASWTCPQSSAEGTDHAPVPDLGPATLMDQLRVMVRDACAVGSVPAAQLAEELAALRRELP